MNNIEIKPFYNTIDDDVVKDFYNPLLSACTHYKRVSAYFDSKILKLYSRGLERVINNNAKIYFIFSHQLSEKDFNEIKLGYKSRRDKLEELKNQIDENDFSPEFLSLAYLIKNQYVSIKIAFTKSGGIFHDKFGIFENNEDSVYFRGSNNETFASIRSNFESFETTCSWNSVDIELKKIAYAKEMFQKLWNDNYSDDVMVNDMTKVIEEKLISFTHGKAVIKKEIEFNYLHLDYENQLVIENRLESKIKLSPELNFFKRSLEAFTEQYDLINNKIYFNRELTYSKINKIILDLNKYALNNDFELLISNNLKSFLESKELYAQKRRSLGIAIKQKMSLLNNDFEKFKKILNSNMERELRSPQIWDAYHISKMYRSANFSVPGSGKTTIVYGAFAYLSYLEKVDKVVVIGPLNSFTSWIKEFNLCFGQFKELKLFDYKKERKVDSYQRFNKIVHEASQSNLALFNYESLQTNLDAIRNIVDSRTLLVFDEVHRIKSVEGIRAKAALSIGLDSKFRVVLTGTPIPNGFIDLYNMLNLLFADEFNDLFSFDLNQLQRSSSDESTIKKINNEIYPFFCRTNKNELGVPKPEPDNLTNGYQLISNQERKLYELIYYKFSNNFLLLYVRLIQASNNPKLLLNNLTNEEFRIFDTHDYLSDFSENFSEKLNQIFFTDSEIDLINSIDMTSKFYRGVDLVEKLVIEGKVIVWGIFVNTLEKIEKELILRGIKAKVISGKTDFHDRESIIENFESGDIQVLITNPHTLGESVSLHKSCHQAVYFELSFNLVHFLQSKDRIHRLGLSENTKTNYYIVSLNDPHGDYPPIDMKIYNRLVEKDLIQNKAISKDGLTYFENDVQEDIEFLFGKGI